MGRIAAWCVAVLSADVVGFSTLYLWLWNFFCGLLIKMGIREYCWSHSKTNIPKRELTCSLFVSAWNLKKVHCKWNVSGFATRGFFHFCFASALQVVVQDLQLLQIFRILMLTRLTSLICSENVLHHTSQSNFHFCILILPFSLWNSFSCFCQK